MTDIAVIDPAQLTVRSAGARPLLVAFIKHDCPWCRRQTPELTQIADEWAGCLDVVAVRVDQAPGLVDEYGLRGTPTLVLLRAGGRLADKHGFQRAQQLRPFLRHYLDVADR